jgi:hypothetical protein
VHRFIRERDLGLLPLKTDAWLTMQEASSAARVRHSHAAFRATWEAIVRQVESGHPPSADGHTLRFEKRHSGSRGVFCIAGEDVSALCAAAGIPHPSLPQVRPGELVREDMARAVGVGLLDARFAAAYEMVRESLATGQDTRLRAMDVEAFWRRNSTWVVPVITEASAPGFARLMGWKGPRPEKGEEWLAPSDVHKALGTSSINPRFVRAWADLSKAYEADALERDFPDVRFGMVRNGRSYFLAIHRDSLPWLAPRLGRTERGRRGKTEGWLSYRDVGEAVPTLSRSGKGARAIFRTWAEELDAGREPMLDGSPVRAEYRASATKTFVCLHASELRRFAYSVGLGERFDLPAGTEGWLSKSEAASASGVKHAGVNGIWDRFEKALQSGLDTILGGVPVRVSRRRNGPYAGLFLHRDDVGLLRAELGLEPIRFDVPEPGPDHLGRREVADAIGVHRRDRNFEGIWRLLTERCREGVATVDGVAVEFGEFRKVSRIEHALHRDALPWYKEAMKGGLGLRVAPTLGEWMTAEEAAVTAGVSCANKAFVSLWKDAVAKASEGKTTPFRLALTRRGNGQAWCAHASAIETIRSLLPPECILRPVRSNDSEPDAPAMRA